MGDAPTIDDVLAQIEEAQTNTASSGEKKVDVIIAPRGMPGYYHEVVEPDDDDDYLSPAFTLDLADEMDAVLYNLDAEREGALRAGGMFLEDVARQEYSDFDGRD